MGRFIGMVLDGVWWCIRWLYPTLVLADLALGHYGAALRMATVVALCWCLELQGRKLTKAREAARSWREQAMGADELLRKIYRHPSARD